MGSLLGSLRARQQYDGNEMNNQVTEPMEIFNDTWRIEVIEKKTGELVEHFESFNLTLTTESYSRLYVMYGSKYRLAVYLLTVKDLSEVFR